MATTATVEVFIEDAQYAAAGVEDNELIAPVAAWFTGSGRNYVTIEFELEKEG